MRSRCAVYVDAGYLLASAATRVTGTSLRSGVHVLYDHLVDALIEQAEAGERTPAAPGRTGTTPVARGGLPDPFQEQIGMLPRVKLRLRAALLLRRAEGRRPADRPRPGDARAQPGRRHDLPGLRRRRPHRGGRGGAGPRHPGDPARRAGQGRSARTRSAGTCCREADGIVHDQARRDRHVRPGPHQSRARARGRRAGRGPSHRAPALLAGRRPAPPGVVPPVAGESYGRRRLSSTPRPAARFVADVPVEEARSQALIDEVCASVAHDLAPARPTGRGQPAPRRRAR